MYKYDTHVHTAETSMCGKVKAVEVARLYKDAGYTGIVITDHYHSLYFKTLRARKWEDKIDTYLKGYMKVLEEGKRIGLNVLLGIELRFVWSFNDYLVYGLDEKFLKEHKAIYKLGIRRFKKLAEENNLLVYHAHPFRKRMKRVNPEYLDGIEVFNGNPRHDSRNDMARNLAAENNLKMLSGSDFHRLEDIGRGGVIIDEKPKTSSEFTKILKKTPKITLIENE